MIKAILFDMDGTVVDSMPLWTQAFNENLLQYNKSIDFSHGKYGGSPIEYILQEVFEKDTSVDYDTLIANILVRAKELLTTTKLEFMPGAREFIEKHGQDKKCAICSGSAPDVIQAIFSNLEFASHFQELLSATEVPNGKPAPDVWLEAAKRLNVKPEECLVVEDARSGMIGGKKAGMKVIGIVRDVNEVYPADKIYSSFTEVKLEDLN